MYQKRYIAYAKYHGKTPQEIYEHDKEQFPGGRMTGFIIWINKMRLNFIKTHPEFSLHGCITNHEAFTKFIQTQTKGGTNGESKNSGQD